MHLDEEQVQRLLDKELSSQAEQSVREHLAGCADCRRRVADAKQEEDQVSSLLRALDHAPPPIRAEAIAARARERDFAWMRQAAAILLAVGIAGAAYAVPGSPVRAWVGAVVEWVGGRGPSLVTPVPEQTPERVSGIAVAPGPKLAILFTSPQPDGRARVLLTGGDKVEVRAPVGAAIFTSSADRLVIDNKGPAATFDIRIPRAAPSVEIRVDGNRIFLKEGARVIAGESNFPGDVFLMPLSPSGP